MNIQRCDVCGRQFIAGYGYSLNIAWLVTGHAYVPAFLCKQSGPSGQHWGCSPEHAVEAIQRCISEHMHVGQLLERHRESNKPRYAEEDEIWAEQRGEEFHIVKVDGGP
jgi:hypothetical protein